MQRPASSTTTGSRHHSPGRQSSPSRRPKSRFSLDHFFRRIRSKSHDANDENDVRRKLKSTSSWKATARPTSSAASPVLSRTSSRQGLAQRRGSKIITICTSGASSASNVRLCQSPGGRGNVTLAIPVTPPTMASGQRRTNKTRTTLNGFSDEEVTNVTAAMLRSSSSSARSSFVFGWRDTEVATTAWLDDGSIVEDESRESERETPVIVFLSSIPHDLIPDIRIVCYPSTLRNARRYIRQLIHFHAFEIRSTKWAAYFLLLIRRARQTRKIRSVEAVSLRWVLCAYVRHEVASRNRQKRTQEKDLHRKMTEYRVAMQCICGTSVIKYGRKGKPHATHLMIDNGDTLRWTSKMLTGTSTRAKKNKSIPLAAILDIRAGPTTDVLHKAVQKGTLRLQDAKFTLSLITAKRTFDIKARNAAEREFLHRSLRFLVSLARDHEKQIAQQVELSIMKRIETLTIWKHGRKGRPHKTRLYVNRFGEVSWQGRTGDTIQLEDIRKIELGHRTAVFQRSRAHGLTSVNHATRCFSLVTRIRTLDIETEDEQQRDWFVVAIRYLMDKVHEKTAALKREKAEKQLKLLQELCHANGNPHQLLPAPHA